MKENIEISEFEKYLVYVGNWIRTKREERKLTQEQVSESTGIEYKYYQKIEGGKANITMETFHKICNCLGIDPSKMLK